MRSIKIINFILVSIFASGLPAYAEEGGGEAPKAEGEAGTGPNNTEFVEYSKRLNKMTQYQTQVSEGTNQLKALIEKKNQGVTEIKDDKNNRENILHVIVSAHKKLETDYAAYNEELRAITYRFPSKGEEIRRKYIPLRPKSLDQVEKEMGLDGELTALKGKVEDKYKVFAPPEVVRPTPAPRVQDSTIKDKKHADGPPRLKLSK
jgi:uncharacterized phage infection (PIP) family protein YhgE